MPMSKTIVERMWYDEIIPKQGIIVSSLGEIRKLRVHFDVFRAYS